MNDILVMLNRILGSIVLVLLVPVVVAADDSPLLREMKERYAALSSELLNAPAEKYAVSNFVYRKDRAEITFASGHIYLMRFVGGRATTAIFFGEGNAVIEIAAPLEQEALKGITGKTSVNESFTFCFIRMADDLDLALRAHSSGEQLNFDYREYSQTKQNQGEFYFLPVIMHERDNYFQLLRSVYDRSANGYFWIDFNQYVVTYDPAVPEELLISYSKPGVVIEATEAAQIQALSHEKKRNAELSDIPYPTTMLARSGTIELSGLDGTWIAAADITAPVVLNRDSSRFVSLFLDSPMGIDSILLDGKPVDFMRRSGQIFVGLILPGYRRAGDTLQLRFFYHAKERYYPAYPFVEQPSALPHDITFTIPKGFGFSVPGGEAPAKGAGGKPVIHAAPNEPYRSLDFQAFTGIDSTVHTAANGMPIVFLKAKGQVKEGAEFFIPDKVYQPAVIGAFDFLTARLGPPPSSFDLTVFHKQSITIPGFAGVPQVAELINETGGMQLLAGVPVAQQWFGALARPATDRESWMLEGAADYLALMYVQDALGAPIFFGEIDYRKNALLTAIGVREDMPLAAGSRARSATRVARASWLFHMLRFAMYDLETNSDRTFLKFLRELITRTHSSPFTNSDVIALAEKHYGQPLDWFFDQWLYRIGIPSVDATYSISGSAGSWQVSCTTNVRDVPESFQMPVVVRVAAADGTSHYSRHLVKAGQGSFTIGPLTDEPKQIVFNELFSMLSRDNVKKQ